jgi:hypothetical protein
MYKRKFGGRTKYSAPQPSRSPVEVPRTASRRPWSSAPLAFAQISKTFSIPNQQPTRLTPLTATPTPATL